MVNSSDGLFCGGQERLIIFGRLKRAPIARRIIRPLDACPTSQGVSAPAISAFVPLTPQATRNVAHRYENGGLGRALCEKARPDGGRAGRCKKHIAMVCSDPPETAPGGPSAKGHGNGETATGFGGRFGGHYPPKHGS